MNDTPASNEEQKISAKQPRLKREPKPGPETLSDFLITKKASAKRFVQLLVKRTPLPDDDLARSHEIINAEPEKMGRVVDLARAASFAAPQPGVLLRWCEQVLRTRDGALEGWALNPGQDAPAELKSLTNWVSDARKHGDKSRKRLAENSLLLGLNLLFARRSLAPVEALRVVVSLRPSARDLARTTAVEREAAKLLARSSYKHLFDFARIVSLVEVEIASAQDSARRASADADELRHQKEALIAETEDLHGKADELTKSLAEKSREITELAADITGAKTRSLQDQGTIKARFRRQIGDHLAGLLADAWDALDTNPPHPDVARERLETAREAIKKEMEWLDKSTD